MLSRMQPDREKDPKPSPTFNIEFRGTGGALSGRAELTLSFVGGGSHFGYFGFNGGRGGGEGGGTGARNMHLDG